jgi:hypothetical protein
MHFAVASALLFLCQSLAQAGPLGLGYADLSAQMSPGKVAQAGTQEFGSFETDFNAEQKTAWTYGLQAGIPLPAGLGLELGGFFGDAGFRQSDTYSGSLSGSSEAKAQSTLYFAGARISLYPAEWMGVDFVPGKNANADGWLFWPTLAVSYSWTKSLSYTDQKYELNVAIPDRFSGRYNTSQDFGYFLILPLAAWATLWASYDRNSSDSTQRSDGPELEGDNGKSESSSFGLNSYWNLVPGAGSDSSRPFLPTYGRRGQLALGFSWSRLVQVGSGLSQARTLSLGAPVGASVGFRLVYSQFEPAGPLYTGPSLVAETERNDNTNYFGMGLTYVFGN